ncbi:MAG TPA: COX15/CtaA family protein [Pseudolabrys sp.]|nr:COX15/CtaA family protein [Pseudolabrys sp.]
MTFSSASAQFSDVRVRAVRLWLLAVAALIFLTLIVGGATRLTQSGLSIVEWKPVTGVVPPLSQQAWQDEFAKYQTIPQYRELNEGMSLDQFKTIYWWEWTHRLLARLIGAVFLLPLLFFLWRGWIERRLWMRLWVIFGLGAFQGAVGWWMVSSGLTVGVSVSQYRLAFHLTLASLIYAAIIWTALRLAPRAGSDAPARLHVCALALAGLMLLQLYLGALVAGLHAGLIYNTWPDIDGGFIPPVHELFANAPWWRNFFENLLTVQFDHRMLAYTIWVLAGLHAIDAWRSKQGTFGAMLLWFAVTLQATLGILTLLFVVPLPLALTHQAFAVVTFTIAVVHAARLWPRATERSKIVGALAEKHI